MLPDTRLKRMVLKVIHRRYRYEFQEKSYYGRQMENTYGWSVADASHNHIRHYYRYLIAAGVSWMSLL